MSRNAELKLLAKPSSMVRSPGVHGIEVLTHSYLTMAAREAMSCQEVVYTSAH